MLSEWAAFSELAKAFAEGEACLRVAGLTGPARAMVVAGLAKTHPRPLLVVAATLADAHRFTQDLKFFGTPAVEFPEREPRLWRGGRQRESGHEGSSLPRTGCRKTVPSYCRGGLWTCELIDAAELGQLVV